MDRFATRFIALLLVLLQIGSIFATPIAEAQGAPEDVDDRRELEKRGGARAFYGFYNAGNSKRDQAAALPYYLYEKRGGGRAFNHNANLFRFDKRGGGRAFAGSWSPYLERDNSYY
ncbi:Neuropeptide-Like Protein [Caenorhabditis elegans]|uniref:Neuropeptide-Like Protein n=1 Tax=Caenorhabditis elegans TaxID=6239 RepID=Q95X67_CAEEL|nr:Neuropeptide-Like Protein [Caenorhabditis elegans]CCD68657.1 Neuropeptide-Like Protein [Caenorhabditis elegans]|eukprot:NP_504169.1 Neuropeptide-Like Protein [Caenorhabditis elegans]